MIIAYGTDAQITPQIFTTSTKGLYIEGPQPFFVSLRFSITSHAEIITSKGRASIGNEFYAVPSPITQLSTINNFTAGILATEDNTTVVVSGYSPAIVFGNGMTGAAMPSIAITLNEGESYLIDGFGNNAGNATGFIGAKISSDKPISVTNGNMTGQFALTTSFAGADIIMDQSVPVERLGAEFILVKGNGNIGQGMEGALVVATEDNTQIFVNGNPTPIATINDGEFYRINDVNFINQAGSGHFNMHISTSENVYVYQLLAGMPTSNATLGFNYIPPMSCYLPRVIDEIGKINEMPGITPTVKLNVITEAGAVVAVTSNGAAVATQGPFPVTGSTNWVSYSIPNITGNVTITSDKAMTAGIAGGSSVYGYGGYFAGFSSTPFIQRITGECIPNVVIGVDDIYETYQWFLNGQPIPGANSHEHIPVLPGIYTLTVGISGCAPVTTDPFYIYPCATETTVNVDVCGSKTFTVAFTNSTETLDLNSIVITTPPANGTVAIDNINGTITYTPNAGYVGADTFMYEFNSTVPTFFDSEIVTVNMNVVILETEDDTLTACPYNGVATFDLTTADLTTYVGVTYNYYPSMSDAQNGTNEIMNPNAYISAAGNVFVKITTPEGCVDYSTITLAFYDQPEVTDEMMQSCFIPGAPTTAEFDLTAANVGGGLGSTKDYFPSLSDAVNNTNEIQNPDVYVSTSTTVYVRVYNANGCYNIAMITLEVILPRYSSVLQDKIICIEDVTTLDAGPGFDAYLWSTGEISQTITNVGVGEYWVVLTTNGCETIQTVKVNKAPEVIITNIEINNNTVTLTVTGGQLPYQYSIDGINWQDSNVFTELPRGQNTFYVKDSFDCDPVTVEITVPNLINVITPNEDGINDYLDYSALRYKENLTFSIYDRYGHRVHLGDKNNDYRWDGRYINKKVMTGTYWYHITWTEPDGTKAPVVYKGWILVKNR
jgi:gliding motility-associated-like protein